MKIARDRVEDVIEDIERIASISSLTPSATLYRGSKSSASPSGYLAEVHSIVARIATMCLKADLRVGNEPRSRLDDPLFREVVRLSAH